MKKVFAFIIIALALPLLSQACNICGCSVYIGILPDFRKHVFGVRYRYSSLHSHVGIAGSGRYYTTLEKFNTVEIWGAWNITSKIRIMGSVPYNFEQLNSAATTISKDGLGDIYALGYYKLFGNSHTQKSGKLLSQNLWFGVGIEIPTGKYDTLDKGKLNESTNFYQLGSGSTDVLFNVVYNITLQRTGLNVSSMYKINTVNKHAYEYGNKFDIHAQAFYKFSIHHKVPVMPNIGIQFENLQRSTDNGHSIKSSGGNLLLGTIGIETNFKRVAIGANFQTPLQQNLVKGSVTSNNICMAHISFTL